MHRYLRIAAHHSIKGTKTRSAFIGAVGVRTDGAIVTSYNGTAERRCPEIHAEARLVRKLDKGSTVYVARTRRDDGRIAMAKPCKTCQAIMKNKGVKRAYYTISEYEWGVIEF